jgi:hypothetical protein
MDAGYNGLYNNCDTGKQNFTTVRPLSEDSTHSTGLEGALSSSSAAFCGNFLPFKNPQISETKCLRNLFSKISLFTHALFWL